jgi:hypothetical protein
VLLEQILSTTSHSWLLFSSQLCVLSSFCHHSHPWLYPLVTNINRTSTFNRFIGARLDSRANPERSLHSVWLHCKQVATESCGLVLWESWSHCPHPSLSPPISASLSTTWSIPSPSSSLYLLPTSDSQFLPWNQLPPCLNRQKYDGDVSRSIGNLRKDLPPRTSALVTSNPNSWFSHSPPQTNVDPPMKK